jgi:CO/xanthine dehydrogenase Mo-binding subunit
MKVVGKSVDKIDGLGLATGQAKYYNDYLLPGITHVGFLYSPYAFARIVSIDTTAAEHLTGVLDILHYARVPRILHTTAGQGYPEPSPYDAVMFDQKVRFVGDRVAAVLAETPEIAEEAVGKIKVEYEVYEPVLDFEKAAVQGAPILHDEPDKGYPIEAVYDPEHNTAARVDINIGDLETGLEESDWTFKETFYTHGASHCMLEPHGVVTFLDAANRLVIITATQVPFHVRRICSHVLQLPLKRIRVIKPRIGGGFGGKQEVFLEYVAGLFTLRTGRPVKIVFTRKEVFISSRIRHPMRIVLKTGVLRDGTIHAISIDALMNTGAYGSHALTVLSNAGSKVLPLINKAPHQRFRGQSVYTNLPVGGAYRGYGATQSYFALGQMMDIMARRIGMDLVDFYKKNVIRKGETSPIFEKLGEGKEGVRMTIRSNGLLQCIDRGAAEINWSEKRSQQIRNGTRVRGLGMACMMQGSGIPRVDMGAAYIKMNEDGSFNLLIGATDIGTGSDTVLAQIAAEALGVETDDILVRSSDTDTTPFDVGAYASSTTYISGEAVRKCALKIRRQILTVAAELSHQPRDTLKIGYKEVVWNGGKLSYQRICEYAFYAENQFQIQATASNVSQTSPPPFSAHFAEVEVDTATGIVEIIKYVAAVDCGVAINPRLAEGQVEGAVVNGISWTLTEAYVFNQQGTVINADWGRYKIYTSADLPEIKTLLIPTSEPTGPYGAKSVSEIAINGPAPTIATAIYDAIGIRFNRLPITPDAVFDELRRKT